VSIKDLERKLAEAERRANAWGIDERLRDRRLDEVAELRAQLADELALQGRR
jgi:hypothetical protein